MRFWRRWERRKEDLHEELEAHLRLAVEERVERGETPEEARIAAMKEMGNLPLVEDVTRRQWGWEWLERIAQDVRYAVRQLMKSPGYTATALLTLTLAIGANTAVFGLLYALLLRSLPVAQPDRIVQIKMQMTAPGGKRQEPTEVVSDGLYDALAGKQTVFGGMCAWNGWQLNLLDAQGARPIPEASVTGGCFRMLGLHPALGRLLIDADDQPGGGPEGFPVVLGYNYWRSHFGADPHVVGRVMHFGASFQAKATAGVVVGVMEPGFDSIQVGDRPSIYVPMEMTNPKSGRNWNSMGLTMLARLKDGVKPAQAQAQVDGLFQAQLKKVKVSFYIFEQGALDKAVGVHLLVRPGRTGFSYLREQYAKPLYLIEGMVGLSLLVACAYLALLSSARALARRRELAIRIALGASRRRVAAGLWLESLLLALAGACFGVLFAWGAERALVAMLKTGAETDPLVLHAGPSGVVLLFTLAVTAFTVLVSGVLPAWRGSRLDPVSDIKEGESTRRGRRRGGVGTWLVPVEIGFSLVIVTIAALMGSTVEKLLAIDPGFRTSGVTFLGADFSSRMQANGKGKPRTVPPAMFVALLDRIRHTPGVESASISQAYPLTGTFYLQSASSTLPSGDVHKDEAMTNLSVTPGYFETLGISVLRGRDFTEDDKGDTPQVCILSRSAAKYFFPGGNALGGTLALNKKERVRVVGVVGDTLYSDLRNKAPRILYLPYLSGATWNPFAKIEVRSRDAATAVMAVRNAFRDLAPDVAVDAPVTMTELVEGSMGRERMVALLSGFFAVLTLVLSAIGMYGLLNYSVVRRRKEIGVRMALGSTRGGVVKLVAREAVWMVVPGLALGGIGAWAATRFVRSLLFEVKPMDPWVMAASAAVLVATAILACLVPARRAAGVDPMEALRCE